MTSEKEKLIAKKLAEIESLKKEMSQDNLGSKKEIKVNKLKLWQIILGVFILFTVVLPLSIGFIFNSSLSPEERAAREIRIAKAHTEQQAATKKRKLDAAIQNVSSSIKAKNDAQILKSISELKKISPEEASKYKNDFKLSKAAIANKERQRKLNYLGNFYIRHYVDEFGERTSDKFIGYKGSGQFSNSATEGSDLNFWIAIDSAHEFDVSLFEYAGNNPVKDIFGGDAFIIRFRYSDVTDQVVCKNNGDRISCGPKNSGKIISALKVASTVKFSIYNQRTTSSRYFFTVNANGFTNAMRKLNE